MTRDVQRWLTHLTKVSGSLTSSLDYDATLRQVVRLPIPTLADWCMVYVPDDGGALASRLVLAHASPAKETLLRQVWHREWSRLPDAHPISESLRKRAPIIVSQVDPGVIDSMALEPAHVEIVRRVGVRSLLVVPLVAHGTVVGGFMLVSSQVRRRPYDDTLLDLVGDLARSYAQAIYNSRLFVETRLALRLRDEVILSARHELLEMVEGLRDRRGRERSRSLTWPTGAPQPAADHPRATIQQRSSEMAALLADMERIAQRLGALVDPYGGRT